MPQKSVEINNRKAKHDYHIHDQLEAGIELQGTEVKSLRSGEANMADAFASIEKGQAWLHNFYISPYDKGNRENHEAKRTRRLLMHKNEMRKIQGEIALQGHTIIPLKGYFKERYFKILLGICSGKNKGDKRQDMKKRDVERSIRRNIGRM
ncbi:MAG: SsrA-binding protein SmpB [Verrucomicrobiota bacterium]